MTILVNRQGEVVSFDARGSRLRTLLEELLGNEDLDTSNSFPDQEIPSVVKAQQPDPQRRGTGSRCPKVPFVALGFEGGSRREHRKAMRIVSGVGK